MFSRLSKTILKLPINPSRNLYTIQTYFLGEAGCIYQLIPSKERKVSSSIFEKESIRTVEGLMKKGHINFLIAPSIIKGVTQDVNTTMDKLEKICDKKDPELKTNDYKRITPGHISSFTLNSEGIQSSISHRPIHDLSKKETPFSPEYIFRNDVQKAIIENETCFILVIRKELLTNFKCHIMPYKLIPLDTNKHDNCATAFQKMFLGSVFMSHINPVDTGKLILQNVSEHIELSPETKDDILLAIAQSGIGDNMRQRSLQAAQEKECSYKDEDILEQDLNTESHNRPK